MNESWGSGGKGALVTEDEWSCVASACALSDRQEQVLRCVFEGLTDKQIARRLRMKLATVRTHMARLRGKLGANNRAGAFQRVWGLIRGR